MSKLLLLLLSLMQPAMAKDPIKIAVIDTGVGFHSLGKDVKLCKYGHKDFTNAKKYSGIYNTVTKVPLDTYGHGTNIAGIIDRYAKKSGLKYCLVIIKFFNENEGNPEHVVASENAIEYAYNLKVDMINYSGEGTSPSRTEKFYIQEFLDRGGIFVAAAGNSNIDLDQESSFVYPAMYDKRIVVVGNITADGMRSPQSNFGLTVNRWEVGEHVVGSGITLTGTSQATAVATGKLVKEKFGEGHDNFIEQQSP